MRRTMALYSCGLGVWGVLLMLGATGESGGVDSLARQLIQLRAGRGVWVGYGGWTGGSGGCLRNAKSRARSPKTRVCLSVVLGGRSLQPTRFLPAESF